MKWVLSTLGGLVVVYCLAVIAFVVTAPDLGLRFLLIEESQYDSAGNRLPGLEVRQLSRVPEIHPALIPQPGDRIVEIARQPISSFLHFSRALIELRGVTVDAGGDVEGLSDTELLELWDRLPSVVERDGELLVKARYLRNGNPEKLRAWLPLQSVPWTDILQTMVWFLLQFGIFAVGALAFWARPFDRQARVFFAMCLVTMGGFVGGYHWWLIAGTLWLSIPFIGCAMLLPVVTLHFFMSYPEPKPPLALHPRRTLFAMYVVPVLWTVAIMGLAFWSWSVYDAEGLDHREIDVLRWLHEGIYVYLGIAAAYFLATLAALAYSVLTTRNPLLHNQVKWILWAAVVATIPVGYTLYLAHFRKEDFALGAASLPMFTASLLFMLAYAVGIVRYKLMLVDQVLTRGMLYYLQTVGVTVLFSVLIALVSLAGMHQSVQVARQAPLVITLVAVTVLILNWSRDSLQQWIDRRYFREKFPLDKALQRMHQSAGGLADAASLAQRLLSSCRDMLGVDQAALYLRENGAGDFRLIASEGLDKAPLALSSEKELLDLLHEESSLHRDDDPGETPSPTQLLLRQFDVELVHALEMDGQLAGVVMLGTKRNGGRYSAEDLALLTSLGQITGVALHGARVQQMVLRLNEELQRKIEKISEQQRLISMLQAEITSRQQVEVATDETPFRRELIKGGSPAIHTVLETVRKVASSGSSVLVRGESGTGKELLAQAIHENSPRRGGPMVSVHCGALSAGLLESELFGHVKGSFTGAHRDKVGRFEMADGGTLFLDEIGDISLETQIKLLRVLQEREFEPVGGTRAVRVDVRLIAATHQNLEKLISEGKFREDLFYRLNVISITLPPLRERGDDIIELALHFLARSAEKAGKPITHFDNEVIDALKRYAWPGNIRELENAIERSVVMSEGPAITLHDLPAAIVDRRAQRPRLMDTKTLVLPRELGGSSGSEFLSTAGGRRNRAAEKQEIVEALKQAGGNKAEAARLLGLARSTFFSRMKKHGLE